MKMSDKLYDALKWFATIVMPSIAVLYGTLGRIWNLPFVEQIPLTINAVQVFLATLLGVSTVNYLQEKKNEKEG